jgi:uncharacterized protein YbjT (DUF2867 family)
MGHRVISISRHGEPEIDERWVQGIEWVSADVFSPDQWAEYLDGAEAVIDCIGRAKPPSDEADIEQIERPLQLIAEHADRAGVDSVVYISAASAPAWADTYIESRRRAEGLLEDRSYSVAVLRPALIEGSDRPESIVEGALVDLLGRGDESREWLNSRRGLRREKVAICALRAALEPDIEGTLDIDDIDHLGDAMFIQ